jgi:hypothetical protein
MTPVRTTTLASSLGQKKEQLSCPPRDRIFFHIPEHLARPLHNLQCARVPRP